MSTMTVRIREDTHRSLKEMAQQTGEAMADILESAIEEYRRQRFLSGLAEDFEALRNHPESWDEEQGERQLWERALGDDLEEN